MAEMLLYGKEKKSKRQMASDGPYHLDKNPLKRVFWLFFGVPLFHSPNLEPNGRPLRDN